MLSAAFSAKTCTLWPEYGPQGKSNNAAIQSTQANMLNNRTCANHLHPPRGPLRWYSSFSRWRGRREVHWKGRGMLSPVIEVVVLPCSLKPQAQQVHIQDVFGMQHRLPLTVPHANGMFMTECEPITQKSVLKLGHGELRFSTRGSHTLQQYFCALLTLPI